MIEPASPTKSANHIVIFQESSIPRVWHNDAWWFSVVDVCAILTASPDAGAYWRKLKQRLKAEEKMRLTDVADTEQILRLVQSIPSLKAEPFKQWLARVGYHVNDSLE